MTLAPGGPEASATGKLTTPSSAPYASKPDRWEARDEQQGTRRSSRTLLAEADSNPGSLRAFLDESTATRAGGLQEYLVGAALIPEADCDRVRQQLRTLLLPGLIKVHWTDEGEPRRRRIVALIQELGPITVVVSHLDAPRRKVERYRRKTLETVYHEFVGMELFDLTLECRTPELDAYDRAHLVALQGQGLDSRLRIDHRRGGDEPLLWIADAVLGAVNAAHSGDPRHLERLESTLLLQRRTPSSQDLIEGERP